jgi:DNA-binding NarL/FixJ family response regulator
MRVIVADDQPEVRSALRLILEEKPGISAVSEAQNSSELLTQVRANCPDLVLLDWELPGVNPKALVTTLQTLCPSLSVVALSSRPQMKQIALEAGAANFVCKSEPPEQLLKALDTYYRNEHGPQIH